jgi:hypothetical protein
MRHEPNSDDASSYAAKMNTTMTAKHAMKRTNYNSSVTMNSLTAVKDHRQRSRQAAIK